ncbi:MAG: esterase/lipase family protein [Halodesulfovibrio sp.]|uniref:esterase/lipase family protein n=1 Tax=Halodesulfovibrio sp. TaxID=1912772 RepID=UPI00359E7A91
MKLVFVHGWSVTDFDTYGELPAALQATMPEDAGLELHHIYLGRYVSFNDEVTLDDIARAFDQARQDVIGDEDFSCVTHSTGGPVVRLWMHLFYGSGNLEGCPLKHLVMLAPANHGSALAVLGSKRLLRIFKKFKTGLEQGIKVLRWLQLGSNEQFDLNVPWEQYFPADFGCYPFVLTGDYRDKKAYDFINPYLAEPGSDGVIRVCSANLNYQLVTLVQNNDLVVEGYDDKKVVLLKPSGGIKKTAPSPLALVPEASHSGEEHGIMRSVLAGTHHKPVIELIWDCLSVTSSSEYEETIRSFEGKNNQIQGDNDQFTMLAFRIRDDRGNLVDDYDMLLLADENYEPDKLPVGFYQDRQFNKDSGVLIYYINYTKMTKVEHAGFRINARPDEGFSYYLPIEFRSNGYSIRDILKPNQTLLVDVTLTRMVDRELFRLEELSEVQEKDFSEVTPSGDVIG